MRDRGKCGRMQRACAVQVCMLKSFLIRLNKWFPLLSSLPLQQTFFNMLVCIRSKAVLFFLFFFTDDMPYFTEQKIGPECIIQNTK